MLARAGLVLVQVLFMGLLAVLPGCNVWLDVLPGCAGCADSVLTAHLA